MTPPTTLGRDCSYMWRNTVQTDGRVVYNVAAHTQGDMSRDMCRGSSLYWKPRGSVLVGVFLANSAEKLNMRQPGGHLTTCSLRRSWLLEFGDDNDLLFTSNYGQDDLDFLYSTFCCQLTSVLRLVPVGAKCSFCAEVLFFICDRLGIAVVYFVADHYILEPFFPFIFESLASMAEHARNYLSALAVSFKRQPPLGMEEEAHWAHA